MTVGIALDTISETLRRVPIHLNRYPIASFDFWDRIGPHARSYALTVGHSSKNIMETARSLPLKALTRLTKEELCKIRHSSFIMLTSSVEKAFDDDPFLRIVDKIRSSAWRWGMKRLGWNEIVDAYTGIKSFSLDVDGFTVTLDMTTGVNACGYSEHSRTFLDGALAFLVHYKDEHVMTIGFSICSNRRLLLQQVQLTKKSGNRWLFKFPKHRLEHVITCLQKAFPKYRVFLVDGKDTINLLIKNYKRCFVKATERVVRYTKDMETRPHERKSVIHWLEDAIKEAQYLEKSIHHLEEDASRLITFYTNAGYHTLDYTKPYRVNSLNHYPILV